jgi:hypothetical protein
MLLTFSFNSFTASYSITEMNASLELTWHALLHKTDVFVAVL